MRPAFAGRNVRAPEPGWACPAEAGREAQSASEDGFSLIEVLIATVILTTALTALAQLFTISTRANSNAKATTYAALLAQQKMEQLRGLTLGFDMLGLRLTDTTSDITVVPELPVGGTGLSPSPANTLGTNTSGFCDFLDKSGTSLGTGTIVPAGAVYIRRWSIEPLPTKPEDTLVLQVLVTRYRDRGSADTALGIRRLPDEARIVSVKTRKAS